MTGSGGISAQSQAWGRGRVSLKFQFGDLVFARASLSLSRRSANLDERPLTVGETPEPPPSLDGLDGYVVWSHPLATALPRLRARYGRILYIPQQYTRFSIDLAGSFDQYMAKFSSKTRWGLRRKLRKFAEASGGAIAWRQYRTPDELAVFFSLASRLSAKTYQERLLDRGLPTDEHFVKSSIASSSQGNVRAYLLFLRDEPISYLYCTVISGIVNYDYLGYDPGCARLSPGTVLQLLALEALFTERRFTAFDFTEGEGQHKELFSTDGRLCGDVYVLKSRPTPTSLVVLHYATDRVSASAAAMLDRVHLRSPFRRLLRGV